MQGAYQSPDNTVAYPLACCRGTDEGSSARRFRASRPLAPTRMPRPNQTGTPIVPMTSDDSQGQRGSLVRSTSPLGDQGPASLVRSTSPYGGHSHGHPGLLVRSTSPPSGGRSGSRHHGLGGSPDPPASRLSRPSPTMPTSPLASQRSTAPIPSHWALGHSPNGGGPDLRPPGAGPG